jgi:hypothetical protein
MGAVDETRSLRDKVQLAVLGPVNPKNINLRISYFSKISAKHLIKQ